MRILMIGGTRFIGRHVVEAALDRGRDVAREDRQPVAHEGDAHGLAARVGAEHGDAAHDPQPPARQGEGRRLYRP